ncbi:hypothetical protein BKA56DRAFT_670136 [Ilyonectria sp. MPI-CAGE-AT-0026]|nr:hypothetical protein BKA56DRAFT_670136 [Ilyonectria sp. MPI-CAGE-AT-0026]
MSSLVNKVKEALHSDKSSEPEGTHGHHNTRAANAADPRIDSDRDHRAAHNLSGNTQTGSGNYATGGATHGTDSRPFGTTDGPATKTDGPHNSNLLNKADPRVDSDRDHSRNMGANPHGTSGTGAYNASENTRTGGLGGNNISENTRSSALGGSNMGTHESSALGGSNVGTHESSALGGNNMRSENTAGYSSGLPEGSVGPHSSRVANAADPRVDSDMDNSRNMGAHSGAHTGTHTGAHTGSGAFGSSTATHGTSTHTGGLGSSTHAQDNLNKTSGAYGSGPAPNTVGPHKSDMMNKIDPRVDSNLDGSKTYGGDKTFERSNNTSTHAHAHRDPTDAAQVPPSVMQQHIGKPTVAHDDHSHDRARRHSVSHQEDHRGL